MNLVVTPLYAGILICLLVILGLRVGGLRRKLGVGIGTGNNKLLAKAVGAHCNAAENIPAAILLMLLIEHTGHAPWLLHTVGTLLVIARLLHAFGVSQHEGYSTGRFYGIITTWVLMLGMGLLLVVDGVSALLG